MQLSIYLCRYNIILVEQYLYICAVASYSSFAVFKASWTAEFHYIIIVLELIRTAQGWYIHKK